MRFSSRLEPDLTPGRLARGLEAIRSAGAALLDLTCSNPPACGLGPSTHELAAALSAPAVAEYHPGPRGLPAARQAVADYYAGRGLPTRPEQIFLSASTSQSYAEVIKLFADPGDEILIPQPSYPLFDMLVGLEGCIPVRVPYTLSSDGQWRIDRSALERALSPRTRAVILVSPNNPTGAYAAREDLEAMQEMCAERGCPILLDEVFADYPASGVCAPLLNDGGGLVIRLSGLSKVIGAPQLKLGWIRLGGEPTRVREAASRLEFIADTYLSASTPAQLAAQALLPQRAAIQNQIRERLETNQSTLRQAFDRRSAPRLLPREGGWTAVLQLPQGEDEEELAFRLLTENHTLVHPGYFYDFPQGEHLILSLIPGPGDFAEGVRRVAARLAERHA